MRNIENLLGDSLHFFDAAAPIVTLESLDMNRISRASRYGRGSDYLNCPMTMREYYDFVRALVSAETAPLHEFETSMKEISNMGFTSKHSSGVNPMLEISFIDASFRTFWYKLLAAPTL